jgi:hypothetical protein
MSLMSSIQWPVRLLALCVMAATCVVATGIRSEPAHADPFDDLCKPGAITDKVDRTAKVYGGGWVRCGANGAEHVRMRIVLFRNGNKVAVRYKEAFDGVTGLRGSVVRRDGFKGKQAWRTKVIVRYKAYGWWFTYRKRVWSNTLHH